MARRWSWALLLAAGGATWLGPLPRELARAQRARPEAAGAPRRAALGLLALALAAPGGLTARALIKGNPPPKDYGLGKGLNKAGHERSAVLGGVEDGAIGNYYIQYMIINMLSYVVYSLL